MRPGGRRGTLVCFVGLPYSAFRFESILFCFTLFRCLHRFLVCQKLTAVLFHSFNSRHDGRNPGFVCEPRRRLELPQHLPLQLGTQVLRNLYYEFYHYVVKRVSFYFNVFFLLLSFASGASLCLQCPLACFHAHYHFHCTVLTFHLHIIFNITFPKFCCSALAEVYPNRYPSPYRALSDVPGGHLCRGLCL